MPFYNFIEIGTSDFDTEIQKMIQSLESALNQLNII